MLSRVLILNFNWLPGLFGLQINAVLRSTTRQRHEHEIWERFGLQQKYMYEVDDTPEARTWVSKKYLLEVDEAPEARTWEIVFFKSFYTVSIRLFVNRCEPEPF